MLLCLSTRISLSSWSLCPSPDHASLSRPFPSRASIRPRPALLDGLHRLADVPLGQVFVPDVHRRHVRELGHRGPIGAYGLHRHRFGIPRGVAVVASGDGEAGDHPLQVILERPRQGLVEVVEAEHGCRSGEAKPPKLDRCASPQSWTLKSAVGSTGQVGGHDRGRAAIEGERRDHHPAVPDRHQVGLTVEVLRDQSSTGSGRSAAGCQAAWDAGGVSVAAAAPRRPRSSTLREGSSVWVVMHVPFAGIRRHHDLRPLKLPCPHAKRVDCAGDPGGLTTSSQPWRPSCGRARHFTRFA